MPEKKKKLSGTRIASVPRISVLQKMRSSFPVILSQKKQTLQEMFFCLRLTTTYAAAIGPNFTFNNLLYSYQSGPELYR